jgi:hypothetical protein
MINFSMPAILPAGAVLFSKVRFKAGLADFCSNKPRHAECVAPQKKKRESEVVL